MGMRNWFSRKKEFANNTSESANNENQSRQESYNDAEKKYENWYSEEESNKRVERLKNALHDAILPSIMVYRCDLAFSEKQKLPESIFSKLESYDLKMALGKQIAPFVNLTLCEYELIKDKLVMDRIKIKVSDYYGTPSYYSVMPQGLFDLLEAATLNGEEYILADKAQVEQMVADHKLKMEQWKKSNS